MSDSAALEFTVDNQISRTFRSVDLSQLVIQTVTTYTEFVLPVETDLRIETSWISDCLL